MPLIYVAGDGTVALGNKVTCDGYLYDIPIRVQTHIHMDHLDEFDRSKGYQDILMSDATRDLLIAERNADLPVRGNLKTVQLNESYKFEDIEIQLIDNGHMLGSVQVAVELPGGTRCGYSGDFNWPIDKVISVNELVVDSTYGSPESVRRYSQEEAEVSLLEIVSRGLKFGAVYIKAHRGTLERAINCLNGVFKCPIIVTSQEYKIIEVYQKYGYNLTEVLSIDSEEAEYAINTGRYIKLSGYYGESPTEATSVVLSAYHSRMNKPYIEYSEKAYAVSLSNHADYEGTLEYVAKTGAEFVITDNCRGGKGVELALSIERELGVNAIASSIIQTHAWGA
jgi:putative mRNA 3-end processing factor